MAKIIDFTIIIFLVGLIIYLIATMSKSPQKENEVRKPSAKEEIKDLISELKFKLSVAKREATEGKEDAVRKMTQYEQELIEAEELLKKYN